MDEEKFLGIFITPSEIGPNFREMTLTELKERYSYKIIQGIMISNIEVKNYNNIPTSRTTSNNAELYIPAEVVFIKQKNKDIIMGDLCIEDDKVIVIRNEINCEGQ